MGKQAKRKNKRRSGDKPHLPTELANDPPVSSSSTTGAIVARIRHGDPRVRHACLVALSRTLYDGCALEKKYASSAVASSRRESGHGGGASLTTVVGTKKAEANDPILLRALSERILDVDVPCATIAVGCLSNYTNFYHHSDDDADDDDDDFSANEQHEEDVTATVLVPILVHKIRDTSAAMHSMALIANEEDNKNNKKMNSSKSKGGESFSRSTSKEDEKRQLVLREQWILQSLLLSTLAGLIENRPRSILQRSGVHHGDNNNNDEVGGNTNVPLVGELISVLELTKDATALTTDMTPIVESAINATRALHSLFDDNASLIDSLLLSTSTTAASTNNTIAAASSSSSSLSPPTLDNIISKLTNIITNEHSPTAARVHSCGSLLALRRIIVLGHNASDGRQHPHQQYEYLVSQLQSCVNKLVIPHLSSFFDNTTTNIMNTTIHNVLSRMITLSNQLSSMKDDESMEIQIVSSMNARGESAMSIAKRQKEMKLSSKASTKVAPMESMAEEEGALVENNGDDEQKEAAVAAMIVEDGDDEVMSNEQRKREQAEDEIKVELDGIVSTWKDIVGTQKLALELVANLYANSNDDEDEDDEGGDDDEDDDGGMMYGGEDDDDEQMWDSDDEAKLLSTSTSTNNAHSSSNSNSDSSARETYESMVDLSPKIIHFFRRWVDFTSDFAANSTFPTEDSNDGSIVSNVDTENAASKLINLPTLVSRDIDEVLSTCALCLGNVVTCNVQIKEEKEDDFNKFLWPELVSMILDNDHNHHRHVTSVMQSVLLRLPPQSRIALIDTATLDRLISLLLSKLDAIDDIDVILELQLCIISMFGMLCTSTHSETVDTKVCRALLSRLTHAVLSNDNSTQHQQQTMTTRYSILIAHEILNVLMDVYGSDDCYEEVFRNECVLDHLHKCLPWFKKTAKSVASSSGGKSKRSNMEEEGFVWNETALNAMRFIKYKQSTQ